VVSGENNERFFNNERQRTLANFSYFSNERQRTFFAIALLWWGFVVLVCRYLPCACPINQAINDEVIYPAYYIILFFWVGW
jgi:hypothetical protein